MLSSWEVGGGQVEIGLDVHRDFCQVAIADGGRARSAGRIATSPEMLRLFAQSLAPTDRVVMEATGNALAIARILKPHVAEVVLAHAKQVRAISHARIKTDKVDAKVLADLLAADLIPAVWIGDERVRMLRRLVSRRRGLVKRRSQIKNEISAALHRNLKGRNPASDPFGKKGREWIAAEQLPIDERLTVDGGLRQLDFFGDELAQIDAIIAQQVLGDEDVRRLVTIPGVDVVTAVTLAAVIGDVRRFPSTRHLVGYLGLHPTIRQSGNGPARHGRLSKEGSAPPATCWSKPPGRPPRHRGRCAPGSSAGKNDTYGFALAAHPGKSQGRPVTPAGSRPIRVSACPTAFSQSPCPGTPRIYDPARTPSDSGAILMPVHHFPGLDCRRLQPLPAQQMDGDVGEDKPNEFDRATVALGRSSPQRCGAGHGGVGR